MMFCSRWLGGTSSYVDTGAVIALDAVTGNGVGVPIPCAERPIRGVQRNRLRRCSRPGAFSSRPRTARSRSTRIRDCSGNRGQSKRSADRRRHGRRATITSSGPVRGCRGPGVRRGDHTPGRDADDLRSFDWPRFPEQSPGIRVNAKTRSASAGATKMRPAENTAGVGSAERRESGFRPHGYRYAHAHLAGDGVERDSGGRYSSIRQCSAQPA